MYINTSLIHVSTRKLRKLSQAKIKQYSQAFEAGDVFPPITLVDCGEFYTIRDGRHRFQAQLLAGFTTVEAFVVNGIKRLLHLLLRRQF